MHLSVQTNELMGLPEGNITLFLAKIELEGRLAFGAVFGPKNTCIPQDNYADVHLDNIAQVALFDDAGKLITTRSARKGTKYVGGGGIVHLVGSTEITMWIKPGDCGHYEFLSTRIKPEDVLITT